MNGTWSSVYTSINLKIKTYKNVSYDDWDLGLHRVGGTRMMLSFLGKIK